MTRNALHGRTVHGGKQVSFGRILQTKQRREAALCIHTVSGRWRRPSLELITTDLVKLRY